MSRRMQIALWLSASIFQSRVYRALDTGLSSTEPQRAGESSPNEACRYFTTEDRANQTSEIEHTMSRLAHSLCGRGGLAQ
jgi:hypothetical protein